MQQFNVVLANPPYSIKTWNREMFAHDKWGRNFLGVPPQGRADYAFFQHIIASMSEDNGRCAILFPHGVLFRDEEAHMRKVLVDLDVLDCVIGLGPNLFFNASMEACIVICRKNKPETHVGHVLFIDAKEEVTRKNAQSYLETTHIAKIVDAYEKYESVKGFAKKVSIKEIKNNNDLLKIQSYVLPEKNSNMVSFSQSFNLWDESTKETHTEVDVLIKLLNHE